MLKKFFLDFFQYQLTHVLGGKSYDKWAEETLTLKKNIPLKNKLLAKELENACKKNGYLTYKEFLTIDQFGTYGYHSTHKEHGMTDVPSRWPEALLALCQKKKLHHIVEFGPGDGKVPALTLSLAKKDKYPLFWSGVEISEQLREKAKMLFRNRGVEKNILQLVSSLEELKIKEQCLMVFSYSLDNLIPDVFINTASTKGYPNAMIGVTVKDGLLSEVILPGKVGPWSRSNLGQRGIFTDSFDYSWDLKSWQLHPMQRVYLPLEACRVLVDAFKKIPMYSQILIIDEFRTFSQKQTYHLGIPRDLETFSRDFEDLKRFYQTLGNNLLYFPIFLNSTISLLSQMGLTLEENMGERKLASILSGRKITLPKTPRTFALLTSPKKKEIKKKAFVVEAVTK